jgi:4-hydroxy-3-polyprenylbenzoate decarboxylase
MDDSIATRWLHSSERPKPALDYQEHLAALDAAGLLVRVDRPINKDTELHPLVRWQFVGGLAEDDRRAFLFTNVVDAKGKRYDIPVAVGALAASPRIYALGMGHDVAEIGPAWLDAIAHPIPPKLVTAPRCQEIVWKGDDLKGPEGGLKRLPVPVSTPGFDSAPYLTATMCMTKDPDTGVRNTGMYRAALKAPDRLVVRMVRGGAGGYFHWQKYRARKEPMPIAIALGCGPVVVFTSPQKLALDQDEMAIAGGLAGQAIPLARAVTIDLDVPATAEIVIEGLIDTETLEPEAPFGESNGYVALEAFNMPMQVTAITMRKNPVFCSIISQVTPSESCVIKKVAYEPLLLAHLQDNLGIRGVRRVVMHEPLSNLRPVIFVQYARGTPRTEVWRGLRGAASYQPRWGKVVIGVSEDIDPVNTDAVFWSIAYRSNPIEDVELMGHGGGVQGAQYGPDRSDGIMLIDATLKRPMPPLALPTREFMEGARTIWQELGLPPLSERAPWHGYQLGNWAERWSGYAKRAVAGDWEETGRETHAKRRKDVALPESPYRTGDEEVKGGAAEE